MTNRLLSFFSAEKLKDAATLPTPEFNALYELYNATNGQNWIWSGNQWDFDENASPCVDNWQGVTCVLNQTSNIYNIIDLNLEECNLMGTLPVGLLISST